VISVSIVLSAYNPGNDILIAVKSVVSQSLKPSELIIINDGSSSDHDRLFEEIKIISSQFPIIIIRNQNNIGLTQSLIKGIKVSNSTYIARLDADDKWKFNHLEVMLDIIKITSADLVGSSLQKNRYKKKIIPYKIISSKLLFNPYYHSSVVFSKRFYDMCGGYDEKFIYSQDFNLWQRFHVSGAIIVKVFTTTVKIKDSPLGISKTNRAKQILLAIKSTFINYGWGIDVIIISLYRLFLVLANKLKRSLL